MDSPLTKLKLLSGNEFQTVYIGSRRCGCGLMRFLSKWIELYMHGRTLEANSLPTTLNTMLVHASTHGPSHTSTKFCECFENSKPGPAPIPNFPTFLMLFITHNQIELNTDARKP